MAILEKMTLEQYHSQVKLPSPSVLSAALKSPAHLAYYLNVKRKPTSEYNFGTLIHEFIENGFLFPKDLYQREEELYLRATGAAKAGDPKLDEDGDPKFTYVCKTDSERSLNATDSKKAAAVMTGLSECEDLHELFGLGKVVVEQSMTGIIDGKECKCRPDMLIEMKDRVILVEIKTTRHGLVDCVDFSRDFFNLNYDMQCYIEQEITRQNYEGKKIETLILAVSTEMPSGASIVNIPDIMFMIGESKAKDALAVWETKPTKMFYFSRGTIELSYGATNYRVAKGIE